MSWCAASRYLNFSEGRLQVQTDRQPTDFGPLSVQKLPGAELGHGMAELMRTESSDISTMVKTQFPFAASPRLMRSLPRPHSLSCTFFESHNGRGLLRLIRSALALVEFSLISRPADQVRNNPSGACLTQFGYSAAPLRRSGLECPTPDIDSPYMN